MTERKTGDFVAVNTQSHNLKLRNVNFFGYGEKMELLPVDTHGKLQREFNFKLKTLGLPLDQMDNKVDDIAMVSFFEMLFRNDIRFKIIVTLSNREAAGLREIARNVGISHKNLTKYIETLEQKGIVETFPIGIRTKVYRLALRYDFVRKFL